MNNFNDIIISIKWSKSYNGQKKDQYRQNSVRQNKTGKIFSLFLTFIRLLTAKGKKV